MGDSGLLYKGKIIHIEIPMHSWAWIFLLLFIKLNKLVKRKIETLLLNISVKQIIIFEIDT